MLTRKLPLVEIVKVENMPSSWYDGWGVHLTMRGWIYNVGGFGAVEFTLRDVHGLDSELTTRQTSIPRGQGRDMTLSHGELAADEIRRALVGEAWHGPSLDELIAGISADEASQRPIATSHSIWELVVHITSWSNIALRRIAGGQVEPFEGEDWPEIGEPSDENWEAACEAMAESYERLSQVVLGLSDSAMLANAPKSPNSVAVLLHGVAQHAAYHGGQIAILKKLVTLRHRRTAT